MFPDEENSLRETASQRLQNDIDREQAALKKRKGGGGSGNGRKGLEDGEDGEEDDEEEGSGKGLKGLASQTSHASGGGGSGGSGGEKKSKHETRLNTLEMTTLGGAAHPHPRERGMSTTDLGRVGSGGGLAAPERRMSGSRSGSGAATAVVAKGAGRMNRLNAGGALTRHGSRTEASDSDTDQPAAVNPASKHISQQSSTSDVSAASSDEADGEAEGEQAELEQRMTHQRELRQQLTHSKETKTPRQPQLHSSPSVGPPTSGGGSISADLELMRLSRDVGVLNQKERGVEKAQLEMEETMRGMQQHIGELNSKVDRLITILLAQGGKAAAAIESGLSVNVEAASQKTARNKVLTPGTSHQRDGSLSHKRDGSISQPASSIASPLILDRRRSVTNTNGRGPPGGAVVAKPNPIAGTVLAGGAGGGGAAGAAAAMDSDITATMSFSTSSAD